jgi:hypothetical protein
VYRLQQDGHNNLAIIAMRQKEVTDEDKTIWVCVQAFSGTDGEAAKEAIKLSEENAESVIVVCTPSGGSASVRLQLSKDWDEEMKEEEIIACIHREKNKK